MTVQSRPPDVRRSTQALWFLCGAAVVALTAAMAVVARGPIHLRERLPLYLYLGAALAYFFAAGLSGRVKCGAGHWAMILVVAAAIRVAMWLPAEHQGDDFARYMWDGAVTAVGVNPYRYSPQQIVAGEVDEPALRAPTAAGHDVVASIHHAPLRTIYPPLAQGLFAVAHWISPFRPLGLRVVFLAADLAAALGVMVLLRSAGRKAARVTIYLWNPLLVFETYHHLHVDIVLAPLLVLLVWALIRRRAAVAGLALAGAIGVKLWPALLLGFVLRAFRRDGSRLAVSLVVLLAACGAMAVPFAAALGGQTSGAAAYATRWAGAQGAYHLLDLAGPRAGRGILAAILVAIAAWLSVRAGLTPRELCGRMGLLVILMLLLSPVLWPWYLVAAIPLAAVGDRPSVLIWTALLALVYRVHTPDGGYAPVVVIHAHVWVLLAVKGWRSWRAARRDRKLRGV